MSVQLEQGQLWSAGDTPWRHRFILEVSDGDVVYCFGDGYEATGMCSVGHFRRWIKGTRRWGDPAQLLTEGGPDADTRPTVASIGRLLRKLRR